MTPDSNEPQRTDTADPVVLAVFEEFTPKCWTGLP